MLRGIETVCINLYSLYNREISKFCGLRVSSALPSNGNLESIFNVLMFLVLVYIVLSHN